MIYTMIITEIDTRVYAATLNYHGQIFSSTGAFSSAQEAEKNFKQRFYSQRFNWETTGKHTEPWNKGVDRVSISWKTTRPQAAGNQEMLIGGGNAPEPKLYELVKDGNVFKVIKHETELLTESQVKLEMFKNAVNN